jgi:hypothetical protein
MPIYNRKLFTKISIIALFISINLNCFSQIEHSKWHVTSGLGLYEALNIGVSYNYKPNLSIDLLVGSQFRVVKNNIYRAVTLQNNWTLKNKNAELTRWYSCQRLIFWHLDDGYYDWKVLSMQPSFGYHILRNEKWSVDFDAGPVFMVVLDFKRKTFDEVGWPHFFMFNSSVKVCYNF